MMVSSKKDVMSGVVNDGHEASRQGNDCENVLLLKANNLFFNKLVHKSTQ